MSATKCLR